MLKKQRREDIVQKTKLKKCDKVCIYVYIDIFFYQYQIFIIIFIF